jgi:transposase InsO family protein
MSLQGSLSIERMCQMVRVSRRGFYRSLQEQQPVEEEMEVRSAIQQIAFEHRRRYGYRRITAELHRRGMPVNHKRVARIMREDNLLGMQPERFVVTTNSTHKLEIYLNLASRMKLTGINQLWVADITYIRLKAEFVYLAVILDGFSRKVVGWALDRTLAIRLTIGALEQATERRQPEAGLVHHSCLWRIDTVASCRCNVTISHCYILGFVRARLAISFFLDVADFKGVRAG